MAKRLGNKDLALLAGATITVQNIGGGAVDVVFADPPKVYAGSEGYAIECEVRTGRRTLPCVFKAFFQPCQERLERSDFLVRLGLAKQPPEWMFQGTPFMVLNEPIGAAQFTGHVAKFVGLQFGRRADTYYDLRDSGWDAKDGRARARCAADIVRAVQALESADCVHGDISLLNIMVGPSDENRDVACLIDFDGFFNQGIAPLPRGLGRTFGTSGFVSPAMLERMARDVNNDDEDLFVSTDRFALAVLCCDMMVWGRRLYDELQQSSPRNTLLSDAMVEQRSLEDLPAWVVQEFPRGFELLDQALQADDDSEMPSPADWLKVLDPPQKFSGVPLARIYRDPGRIKAGAARLRSQRNNFGPLNPRLRDVSYVLDGFGGVQMKFAWGDRVTHVNAFGEERDAGKRVPVSPGDIVRSGGWQFHFEDDLDA